MRAFSRTDRLLLGVLTPVWLVCVVLHVDRQVGDPPLSWVPLYVSAGGDPSAHPTVTGYWPETPVEDQVLGVGDRLLAIGGRDARGLGRFGVWAQMLQAATPDLRVPVTSERDGRAYQALLPLRPMPFRWSTLPLSLALGLSAVLAILRGRGSPAARAYALGAIAYSLQWSFLFGGRPWQTYLGLALFFGAGALYQPLTLRAGLMFPDDVAVRGRLPYLACWAFSITAFGLWVWLFGSPLSGGVGLRILGASYLVWIVVFLAILARNYRRTDASGRRQLKWVLYGFYVGLGPVAAGALVFGTRPDLRWIYELSLTATIFLPVCLYIAFIRHKLYDIDRLITTTIAYTILAPVFVGLVFSVGVPLSEWTSEQLGLARATVLWLFAVAIAAPAPLIARRLQPGIRRLLFRDQLRFENGIRELRSAVADYPEPGGMIEGLGKRLNELLGLESLAIYARTGGVFAPVFGAGPIIPPGFDASGALCALIADADSPVDPSRLRRWLRSTSLAASDRAALEGLASEVIVPLRRGEVLDAFLCLGDKRSGEPYSAAELALLEGLAERVSSQLSRYEEDRLLEEQRGLYEKLAHYAPGTVRDEIVRGHELEPGEKEVSVLFVDVRGYTAFSQGRDPREIFRVVNAYTTAVSRVIREHGGSVVEFHGDGLMAAFGAPSDLPQKERAAVEAARAVVKAVEGGSLGDLAEVELSVGVGVATGPDYVGDIQSIDRKIWGVIGNTTNLAARLEQQTRTLDVSIVIDALSRERAGPSASDFQERRGVRVKGRDEAFTVYVLPRGVPA